MPPTRLDGQPFEDPFPDMSSGQFIVNHSSANRRVRQPIQDVNAAWYNDRLTRGALGESNESQEFMLKRLFFEAAEADDFEWGPIRMLGKGGYGRVGLWEKRDASNQPVDEVVCKEIHLDIGNLAKSWRHQETDTPRLSAEAVFQRDMNVKRSGVAPHLRRYRFIAHDTRMKSGKYRLYSEFCPHNDLNRLRRLYRCWDRFLPEVFVWYVFKRLAWASETLREHPPQDTLGISSIQKRKNAEAYKSMFCLHMDMKPQNILLSGPDTDHGSGHDFPTPLLNDFGVSVYTNRADRPRNPTDMWWRGTRDYDPTEQQSYGVDWEIPPDDTRVLHRNKYDQLMGYKQAKKERKLWNEHNPVGADVFFDHSFNIYGIGHIMYSVVTLTKDGHLRKIQAKSRRRYQRYGNHQISGVYTKKPGVYSSHLRRLIHRCLDPSPAKRPTQLELMDETTRGLRMAEKRAQRDGTDSEKLYFRGHEINGLPLGDAGFQPWSSDWKYFITSEFVDPDLPKIRLPTMKYGKYSEDLGNPSWKRMYDEVNDHEKWFQPVFTSQPPRPNATSPSASPAPAPAPAATQAPAAAPAASSAPALARAPVPAPAAAPAASSAPAPAPRPAPAPAATAASSATTDPDATVSG